MIQKIKIPAFLNNIELLTKKNNHFRNVIYTSDNLQLVLMSLKPGEKIGGEIHSDVDQFFRIEIGRGEVTIGVNKYEITKGDVVIIPKGIFHNIRNTGMSALKLYTLYSPPEHEQGEIVR
jgi:mannose-6-phosphate isomerase-like protein (cupin superfamily)